MAFDLNATLAEAKRIANDETHGYNSNDRLGNPDYDCSSFVAHCLRVGGLNVSEYMSTSTEADELLRVGFSEIGVNEPPQPGDIYFWDGTGTDGHTFLIYDSERYVHASGTKTGDHGSILPGDQNQHYYGLDSDGFDYHGEICFNRLPLNLSEHEWHHFRFGDIPPTPPRPTTTPKHLPIWLMYKITKGEI